MTEILPTMLRTTVPARLEEIDGLCSHLNSRLEHIRLESETFVCCLILREMLLNAITHGCMNFPNCKVDCKISIIGNEVCMTVRDHGKGFDVNRFLNQTYDPEKETGRGLFIIQKYADRFRFNRAGNCLSVVKKIADVTAN